MAFSLQRPLHSISCRLSGNRLRSFKTVSMAVTGSPLDTPGAKVTSKSQLKECRKRIEDLLKDDGCNPILVRLAWHDSGTFDKVTAGPALLCFA